MFLLELFLAPFIIFAGVLIAIYLVTMVLVTVPMAILMGIGVYLGIKEKQLSSHTDSDLDYLIKIHHK